MDELDPLWLAKQKCGIQFNVKGTNLGAHRPQVPRRNARGVLQVVQSFRYLTIKVEAQTGCERKGDQFARETIYPICL